MNIVQSSRQLPYTTYFYDNTDNRNNGKNGRNALCHKVTYNWDNKITVANSLSSSTVVTERNSMEGRSLIIRRNLSFFISYRRFLLTRLCREENYK